MFLTPSGTPRVRVETYREPVTADRVRQDPLDPAPSRHLAQCEFVGESDAAMLRVLLKVIDKGRLRLGRMRRVRSRLAGCALR